MDLNSLKIETPNLDSIFSLENFKYIEIKKILADLYDKLGIISTHTSSFAKRLENIPSGDDISVLFKRCDALD